MNNNNNNNLNENQTELENQLKFWSKYELFYLFKNKNKNKNKNENENENENEDDSKLTFYSNFNEKPILHSNYILKYNTPNNKIIEYNLKHPTWSKTLFNFVNDMIPIESTNETKYDSDIYDIPLFQTSNINIDNNNINLINQTGNGVCDITLKLYCYFFENFDFENEINQNLITRIYTNSNHKIFNACYIFNDEDYLIPDINNFIKYFEFENENEKNEKTIYKKIEIIQSLLCLSNFLDCQLLYSFSISRMIKYLKEL